MKDATVKEERDHDQPLCLPRLTDGLADESAPIADRANEQVLRGSRPALVGGKAAPSELAAYPRAERTHVASVIPIGLFVVPDQGGVDVRSGYGLPSPVAAKRDPAEWARGRAQR